MEPFRHARAVTIVCLLLTAGSFAALGADAQFNCGVNGGAPPNHLYSQPYTGVQVGTCNGQPTAGEFGLGFGAIYLFSRAGSGPDPDGLPGQGEGAQGCYGPAFGDHHGAHATIHVMDNAFGGRVGFVVTRDWNRTTDNVNPWAGTGNDDGHGDCGDNLIEPCPPGYDDTLPTWDPNAIPGGCNHLDASIFVAPGGLLAPNTWTAPSGTLADFAGADGAIVVFIVDLIGSPSTAGKVWTG